MRCFIRYSHYAAAPVSLTTDWCGLWDGALRCVERNFGKWHFLVSWCFEPSQTQRIILGLYTNFILSPNYSVHKPSYHRSCFCFCFFYNLFIFRGHSTRESASSRVTYCILRAYTGTGASHMKNSGKLLEKNAGERTGLVEIGQKKSLAVDIACMAIYWPTPGFKGRTFKLCVLNRWDLISVSPAPHCKETKEWTWLVNWYKWFQLQPSN